jgi:serine/threonine protein kinase
MTSGTAPAPDAQPPPLPAEPPPARIGRFVPRSIVADGGYATVFCADDPLLDDQVAIKLAKRGWESKPAVYERLLDEGRLLRQVRSPNLVTLYDAGTFEQRPYLVMELAHRGSLRRRLVAEVERDPWSTGRIVSTLSRAISDLHAAGIVHCDVHPGNLLITTSSPTSEVTTEPDSCLLAPDERMLLCDLDIAVDLQQSPQGPWRAGGTPRFRAPEQIREVAPISVRTDVYGATAVLWSTVTGGGPPHPEELTEFVVDLPQHWRAVVETGMDPEPDRRFDSIHAWESAVMDALNTDLARAGHDRLS